jgi:hypothetical protein
MDMAQAFVFDVGWAFFAAWGMVLAAISVIAFGRDLFPSRNNQSANKSTVA